MHQTHTKTRLEREVAELLRELVGDLAVFVNRETCLTCMHRLYRPFFVMAPVNNQNHRVIKFGAIHGKVSGYHPLFTVRITQNGDVALDDLIVQTDTPTASLTRGYSQKQAEYCRDFLALHVGRLDTYEDVRISSMHEIANPRPKPSPSQDATPATRWQRIRRLLRALIQEILFQNPDH